MLTWGQQPAGLLQQAAELRMQYRFTEAADLLSTIIRQSADSTERQEAARLLILCENGQTMLRYIERPAVTGKTTVPKNGFYQYYDIELPGAWATLPAAGRPATTTADTLSPVFIPTPPTALYFAACPTEHWDIFVVRRLHDTLWTPPEPLNSSVNTPFDERFPYVAPDGKTLYFASNGHSGMGGYDLYKSVWNPVTQVWDPPENLGFPYSSPDDDWLFVPDITATTALFASSREQKTDSLTLYRIALEANPIKQPGYSIQDVRQIGQLEPAAAPPPTTAAIRKPAQNNANDADRIHYRLLARQQADEQKLQQTLRSLRKNYGELTDAVERAALQNTILEYETDLSRIQADMRQTIQTIRETEKELLAQGIVPDARPATDRQPEIPAPPEPFNPQCRPTVAFPAAALMPPVKKESAADPFRFKIEKTSVVYPWPAGVPGLVYRIQIGTYTRKLAVRDFKGLSPVFEQPDKKRYIYYIGQFQTCDETLEALSEVKQKGFRDALLIAAIDGKKTTLSAAREYEQRKAPAQKPPDDPSPALYHVVLGEFANGLPATLQQAVKAATQRDIVKKTSRGHTVYIVGPFASLDDAQQLQTLLQAQGFETRMEN